MLAKHLTGFSVNRPELDADPVGGDPRTVRFRFEFAGEDRPFEDEVLEKTVWMGKDGMGSEPVQVRWKEGKDLSGGVTAATQRWWEAGGKADGPEWKDLIQKVEEGGGVVSFFAWFAWVGTKRPGGRKVEEGAEEEGEAHPGGEEIAVVLAEEVWPDAVNLFTQAQEDDGGEGELDGSDSEEESLGEEEHKRDGPGEGRASKRVKV